jgi:hypothetical protein
LIRAMDASASDDEGIWGPACAVLGRLTGRWVLERSIDGQGSMRGEASFEPTSGDWVHYGEEGELRLENGQRFVATRRYRYRGLPDGFAVFFCAAPGRLFHQVSLMRGSDGGLRGEARHLCAHDLYLTDYLFTPDGQFRVRHKVRGPRKDFTISTGYRRVQMQGSREGAPIGRPCRAGG